jgi:hypothetical protein
MALVKGQLILTEAPARCSGAFTSFFQILSWTLLPVLFSIYVLATKVDWIIFSDSKKGDLFISSLYLVVFAIHFLGLFISFRSFRATVLLNRNDDEIMNEEGNGYTMPHSDGGSQ